MSRPSTFWSEQAFEIVKDCRAKGLSASQIASELARIGCAVTRNAVLGLCHRRGIDTPANFASSKPKRRPRPRVSVITNSNLPTRLQTAPKVPDELVDPGAPITSNNPVKLHELEHHYCKAIIEDDERGVFYCGNRRVRNRRGDLSPYCGGHYARFSAVPSPTRRQRPVRA